MGSRAKSYLKPYFVIFLANLFFATLFDLVQGEYQFASTVKYAMAGIYSYDDGLPLCGPIWFLTCLLVSYVYFWFLVSRKKPLAKLLMALGYLSVLSAIRKLEEAVGITELPWHIDTALVASVFMLVGYELKQQAFRWCKPYIGCGIGLLIVSSIVIMKSERVIMVRNQYSNVFLFAASASAFCVALIYFASSMTLSGISSRVLRFWGNNTLIFMGINYVGNAVARRLCPIGSLYWVFDTFFVMICGSMVALILDKYNLKRKLGL